MNAICTLFEGDYHLGAGALINSLHASGYRGPVICGHRGPRPEWARVTAIGGLDVRFIAVTTDVHLTFYKPEFLKALLTTHVPEAKRVYYFDPDIVVRAPWEILSRWADDGIALCEDVNPYLPARHPYRLRWGDFLGKCGLEVVNPIGRYYNAGFIGLPRRYASFLDRWNDLNALCLGEQAGAKSLKIGNPNALFHSTDQDALNLSLMSSDVPVNGTGPEGMGFVPGGYLLSHAIGDPKPWRGNFLRAAFGGRPPSAAHKAFFRFVDGPVPLFRAGRLARLRLSLRAAAMLGRVYRRT